MPEATADYFYNDSRFDSEREMVVYLLDDYRCVEAFAARYLGAWREVTRHPLVKGGLRIVCGREATHARELGARLRELGGTPTREMPADRLPDVEFYASPEHTDAEKLARTARRLRGHDVLGPIEAAMAQIREDVETRELLRTILDDERASIRWIFESQEALGAA